MVNNQFDLFTKKLVVDRDKDKGIIIHFNEFDSETYHHFYIKLKNMILRLLLMVKKLIKRIKILLYQKVKSI